jgi:hypothetical protein
VRVYVRVHADLRPRREPPRLRTAPRQYPRRRHPPDVDQQPAHRLRRRTTQAVCSSTVLVARAKTDLGRQLCAFSQSCSSDVINSPSPKQVRLQGPRESLTPHRLPTRRARSRPDALVVRGGGFRSCWACWRVVVLDGGARCFSGPGVDHGRFPDRDWSRRQIGRVQSQWQSASNPRRQLGGGLLSGGRRHADTRIRLSASAGHVRRAVWSAPGASVQTRTEQPGITVW